MPYCFRETEKLKQKYFTYDVNDHIYSRAKSRMNLIYHEVNVLYLKLEGF